MNLSSATMLALSLAGLLAVVGLWTDAWWAIIASRGVLALVVCGLAYELIATRRPRVTATWPAARPLQLGHPAVIDLEFANATGHELALEFEPVFPAELDGDRELRRVLLPAASRTTASLDVRAVRLGETAWARLPARVRGPLGLAWWKRPLRLGGAPPRIVPEIAGRVVAVASTADGATSQERIGVGGSELHHLRAYRAGDPRQRIDWKATARAGQLITRVSTEDQRLEVMLLVDGGRTARIEIDGLEQLGHYVNLAARLAELCIASDDQVGLVAFAERVLVRLAPGRGMPAARRIREALGDIRAAPVESDVLEAVLAVRKLVRHRCLVVILTDLYEQSATSRLAQSARALMPQHLPMIVGLLGEEVGELARRSAGDWRDPYLSLAARDYEHGLHGNVARLRQLGAHALIAHPSEIERKALGAYRQLRAQRRI